MIDFHNHVVPNIDDGSVSLEMSIKMIEKSYKDGFSTIINTIHLNHPTVHVDKNKIKSYSDICKKLEKECAKRNILVKIVPCAEVYYNEKILDVCLQDNVLINENYMLVEFHPSINPYMLEENFYKLQLIGITPIIAHPERYAVIQKDISIIKSWIEKGYLIQINSKSIIERGKILNKTAHKLIKNGLFHLIGSDAHNDEKRNFCLKECLYFLDKHYGESICKQIIDNSENLLNGKAIRLINIREQTFLEKLKAYI